MIVIIKIAITLLLLGCLLDVPYGYFQFVRISCTIGFAYLAYKEFEDKKQMTGLLCVAIAILLNPLIKIHFKRITWNIIDVALAAILFAWIITDLISLIYGKGSKKSKES